MIWYASPITINVQLIGRTDTTSLQVPCGKCLACRIKKRQEWSMRCMHELDYWSRSSFLTLTYSDTHLPDNGSLSKRHLSYLLSVYVKISERGVLSTLLAVSMEILQGVRIIMQLCMALLLLAMIGTLL